MEGGDTCSDHGAWLPRCWLQRGAAVVLAPSIPGVHPWRGELSRVGRAPPRDRRGTSASPSSHDRVDAEWRRDAPLMAPITPQIGVAYTQCKRKAFFLLQGQHAGKHNKYIAILEKQAAAHRDRYIQGITESHPHLIPYSRPRAFGDSDVPQVTSL